MIIFFKYENKGELVLKGYICNFTFEFQAYDRCAWIHFNDTNDSFILKETELNHFCSWMTVREARWLIRKGFVYMVLSKIFKQDEK